jgi:hypothetical protein
MSGININSVSMAPDKPFVKQQKLDHVQTNYDKEQLGKENNIADNTVALTSENGKAIPKAQLIKDLDGAIATGSEFVKVGEKFITHDEAVKLKSAIEGKIEPDKSSGQTFRNPVFASVVEGKDGLTVTFKEAPRSTAELKESFSKSLGEGKVKDNFTLTVNTTGKSPSDGWGAFDIKITANDNNQEFVNTFDPKTKRSEEPDAATKKEIFAYAKATNSDGPIVVNQEKFNDKFNENFKPGQPFTISVDDKMGRNTFVQFSNGNSIHIDPTGAEIIAGKPPVMYHVDAGTPAYNDMMKTLHLAPPSDDKNYQQIPAGTTNKTVTITGNDTLVVK